MPAPQPPPLLPRPSRRRRQSSREVPINLATVRGAAQAGCTIPEIAALVGISAETLRARMKRDSAILDAVEVGSTLGRAILRTKLWNKAVRDGHPQTLQFLAKSVLGLREDAPPGGGGTSFLVETRPKAASPEAWAEEYAPLRGDSPPKAG